MTWRRLYENGCFFNFEGKTSGIKNLQIDSFLGNNQIIPPFRILNKYNSHCALFGNICNTKKAEISRLTALRDRLLPLLMNGQVEVGEHGGRRDFTCRVAVAYLRTFYQVFPDLEILQSRLQNLRFGNRDFRISRGGNGWSYFYVRNICLGYEGFIIAMTTQTNLPIMGRMPFHSIAS